MDFDLSENTKKKINKEELLKKLAPGSTDWEEELMYESPIRMITDQIHTKMEADCLSVVQHYGFDVDKEELAKALAYDRDQYDKGFKDARTVPVIVRNLNSDIYTIGDTELHGYLDRSRNLLFLAPGITTEFAEQNGWVIEEIKEPFGGA